MVKLFSDYDLYIFDLDNTIIDENSYLFYAYKEVANFLSVRTNFSQSILEEDLMKYYNEFGRYKLFNRILEKYKLPAVLLNEMLTILRKVKLNEKLQIYPEIYNLLGNLMNLEKVIYILTNGNKIQQKNKISQIEWKELKISNIVFADDIVPKPSPLSVFYILKQSKIPENRAILIGDSEADKKCALNSGIYFINVKEFINQHQI